jgi:hypothetical protein
MELYKNGEYEKAMETFERAKKCPDVPSDGLETLNAWIKKCNNPPVREFLKVTPSRLLFTSAGGYGTVSISASGKWDAENLPSWCREHERRSTALTVYCANNDGTVSRSDSLIIVMGNRNEIVYLEQEAAKIPAKTAGKIRFRIVPASVSIDFGTGEKQQLTGSYTEIEKEAKEYNVKITKDGYQPVDTLVAVSGDGNVKTLDIVMKPLFSIIRFDIATTDGLPFHEYPVIKINAGKILYDNSNPKSFSDVKDIEYFSLYRDGYVLVPPDTYTVSITADRFEPHTREISVGEGDTATLEIRLKPVSGYLTVIDGGGAAGAKVFINGRQTGTVDEGMFRKELRTGDYKLRFEKDGFITPEKEYTVTVTEKTEEKFPVSMTAFGRYRFTSVPSAAEIFVNGNREGYTPADVMLKEGNNEIILKRLKYRDYKTAITVSRKPGDRVTTVNAELQQTFPVKITDEKDSVNIVIKNGREVFASEAIEAAPAELLLPHGKYRLKSYEYGKKQKRSNERYSGSFVHNAIDGDTTFLRIPHYSWGTFTALAGDYFVACPDAVSKPQTGQSANYYNLMANLHLGRFNVLRGLSTSIFRTSVFNINSAFKGTSVEPDADDNIGNSTVRPGYLFSASCLFLNGEFRIGGYLSKHIGVCLLGDYAWYPDLTKFLPFSHIGGQEIFIGVEVTSRINCFNVNFKLGKEIYKGNYNIYMNNKQTAAPDSGQDKKFVSNAFELNGFVFKAGFSLGRKKIKGNNMLRVFGCYEL